MLTPQLKIAIFWSSKTIVFCGALRVKPHGLEREVVLESLQKAEGEIHNEANGQKGQTTLYKNAGLDHA